MANKTAFLEKKALNRWLRRDSTAVGGGNASTTNIVVASSTGFDPGDLVKLTTPGSYHLVTAVPDGTHITISPAAGSAPTTGNIDAWGYSPALIYCGLYTAAPTDAGGGTEVTGGAYARAQITQANASWAAPSGTPSTTSNSNTVAFPAPVGANWGLVTHFGIFDALTGGNLLAWNILLNSKNVNNGDAAPTYVAGALTWAED